MKIILNGLCGFMCKEVIKLANANYQNAQIVGGIDPFMSGNEDFPCVKNYSDANFKGDCIVDFSHHSTTPALLDYAIKNNLPLVLCTTGHTEEEKQLILNASIQNSCGSSSRLVFLKNFLFGIIVPVFC